MTGETKAMSFLDRRAERMKGNVNAIVHGARGIQAANDLTEREREVALQQHSAAFKSALKSKGVGKAIDAEPDGPLAQAADRLRNRTREDVADKAMRVQVKAMAAQPTAAERAEQQAPITSGPASEEVAV